MRNFQDMLQTSTSSLVRKTHCVKNVRIRSYSGPYFPAFGLNTERYGVSLRIQSECGKIRTRITPNTDALRKDKIAKGLIKLASDALSVVAALSLWVNIEINKSFQSKKRFLLLLSFYSMLVTR